MKTASLSSGVAVLFASLTLATPTTTYEVPPCASTSIPDVIVTRSPVPMPVGTGDCNHFTSIAVNGTATFMPGMPSATPTAAAHRVGHASGILAAGLGVGFAALMV